MFEDGDRVVGVELRISYWQLVGGGQMTDWCQHSHVGPGQPCSLLLLPGVGSQES